MAYGNVPVLTQVLRLDPDLADLLAQPNHQDDTAVLATCSKGNTDMLEYLSSIDWPSENGPFHDYLTRANKNQVRANGAFYFIDVI